MPSSRKVTVGLFLAAGVLLFTVGLFLIGDRRLLFSKSITLYAEFREVAGLQIGSKVLVAGMNAGEVESITVPPGPDAKFRVGFRVLEKFRPVLRQDSVATIEMDGLVGNKILQVGAGSPQGREVRDGDTIAGREALEVSDMIQRAVDTVEYAKQAVDDVKRGVDTAVDTLAEIGASALQTIRDVGDDVQQITATGDKVVTQVGDVIEGVKAGRGTVGKLVTDDSLFNHLRGTMQEIEETAQNLKQTSADMQEFAEGLKSGNIARNAELTMENIRVMTEKGKEAMAALTPSRSGGESLTGSLRQTLSNTREATSDLAENMEALKRNFFLRGFFKRRGFFDLDAVSVDDYMAGKFAPSRVRRQQWVYQTELFQAAADGAEELSEQGKARLDRVMADFLRYARTNPIIVEGYASEGTAEEQFLTSLDRAEKVRAYLVQKFKLNPNYVGVMPLGAVKSSDPSGKPWDGVAVVLFLPKDVARAAN